MLFLFTRLKGTITTEILVFCFFRSLHCFPVASGHKIVNTSCPAVEHFSNIKLFTESIPSIPSRRILGNAVLVYRA